MSRKLIIALSAAIISAKMAGAATQPYSEQALDDLEALIDLNNLAALHAYIVENQTLTIGDSPLAQTTRTILGTSSFAPGAFHYEIAANNGSGKGRGYVPWSERPGKGRKDPPPKHPHIY